MPRFISRYHYFQPSKIKPQMKYHFRFIWYTGWVFYENKKSFAKLSCPIVACELGRFYKKEAVIELLLDRNQLTGRFSPEIHETCFHIRNMKDVTVSQWNAPKPFLLRNLSILCNFFYIFQFTKRDMVFVEFKISGIKSHIKSKLRKGCQASGYAEWFSGRIRYRRWKSISLSNHRAWNEWQI